MDNEPFVMKSVDRAREWVDAYAKATESEKEEASSILATLCGFGTWDVMVFAIDSMPPSARDEMVDKAEAQRRHDFYMHVFVCMHNIRPPIASYLTSHLSPSASYPFAGFSLEEAFAKAETWERQAVKDRVEELARIPDPVRLFSSANLCSRVNVQGWCVALELLGWEIDPDSIDLEADTGEHSFDVLDKNIGTVPIYLSGQTRIPETDDDPSTSLFMKACLGDFILENEDIDASVFLILWSAPQHKNIDGKDFCCIGVSYNTDDECFKDLIVSTHCDSPENLLDLNASVEVLTISGLQDLDERLVDENRAMSNLLAVILSGQSPADQPEDGWTIAREEDPDSGWGIVSAIDPELTPSE